MGAELRSQRKNEENKAAKIAKRPRNSHMRRVHKALEEGWGNNRRARFIMEELDKKIVDKEGSIEWIRNEALKYDNERLILAVQDNGL